MYLDVYAPISAVASCGAFRKSSASRIWRSSTTHWSARSTTARSRSRGNDGLQAPPARPRHAHADVHEPGFLLKIIPHVDGKPRICELIRYYRRDVNLHGAWTGPCALDLHPHALAPMTELPVLEIVSGVHLIADFTLPHGEVVHDYLA